MQVFISHIDCLVTTQLDWTENLFVHEQTCKKQDAEANRCGVTFQSTISAHKHGVSKEINFFFLFVCFNGNGCKLKAGDDQLCLKADTAQQFDL